jgi:hypothetical protein
MNYASAFRMIAAVLFTMMITAAVLFIADHLLQQQQAAQQNKPITVEAGNRIFVFGGPR